MTWQDEDRACEHDVFARRGYPAGSQEYKEAFWWNAEHLVVVWCREHSVWIEFPKPVKGSTRRRNRERAVKIVKVVSDTCGVCGIQLYPKAVWPDDLATTRGHEPPLSRAQPGDTVTVRPEHWICNQAKGSMTDEEYRS